MGQVRAQSATSAQQDRSVHQQNFQLTCLVVMEPMQILKETQPVYSALQVLRALIPQHLLCHVKMGPTALKALLCAVFVLLVLGIMSSEMLFANDSREKIVKLIYHCFSFLFLYLTKKAMIEF